MAQTLEEVRQSAVGKELDEALAAQFPVKEQYDLQLPREEGDVHVYVYVPEDLRPDAPAIMNMHGGGFVKGYRGRDIVFSRSLAYHTGHLVIDVDYTTAPERQYPYALEEGYYTAKYFCEHAATYGIAPGRIIVSGCSAGANMVTGINFLAQDRKEFEIVQTVLAYPPLDLFSDPLAKMPNASDAVKEFAARGQLYNDWYVDKQYRKDICVSPVFAPIERLRGLSPFLILTAENDNLCAEGEEFGQHLIAAGVTVTIRRTLGAGHGFLVRRQPGFEQAEELFFRTVRATDDVIPTSKGASK